MRSGKSLSEAMEQHKSEQNAFWLWACNGQAGEARAEINADGRDNDDSDPPRRPHRGGGEGGGGDGGGGGGGGGGPWTPPPCPRPPRHQRAVLRAKGGGKNKAQPNTDEASDEPRAKRQRYATTTKGNKPFCVGWNVGRCKDDQCPNGKVHACNLILDSGKTSGGTHRCCEAHKA